MRSMMAAAVLVACSAAQADTVHLDLRMEYSGSQEPDGSLTATFTDVPGGVELTLSSHLMGREFVSDWLFNLESELDPDELHFMKTDSTGSFADPVISTGFDAFGAGGGSNYDVQFSFSLEPGHRFGEGDEVVYLITSSEAIDARSFRVVSSPDGGKGPYLTAAHVQGVGPAASGSGWLTTCYADCDENGVVDFFDFLCFQQAFLAGDPYADCDGDGTLDMMDFLCFQGHFAAGCP